MTAPLQAVLVTALWCVFHSLFITHAWRRFVARNLPGYEPWQRLAYVVASSVSFLVLALWLHLLPARTLWAWDSWWGWLRWLGLAVAGLLFLLGTRAHDGRAFLGLRRLVDHVAGRPLREPPFREDGILGVIRHPWYTGTLLLLVFCLSLTDVNLVWRSVLAAYVLVGTELEERKLLRDLGETYAGYRRRVPRFLPRTRRRR